MARKKAVCKRVSDALSVISRGSKGVSSLSRSMRHHLQRCRECGRKHTALLQALVDWTGSQALNLKKREPALAHQLVLRLVRGAYLFASPLGFPSLKKHELYLLHDVIAQIIAAGAGTVLPFLPAVLREVAQDKAKYFAVPVPHE